MTVTIDTNLRGAARPSAFLQAMFGLTVALVVLNLFATQPLVGLIAHDFALSTSLTGLVTASSLLGYALGLFGLVPLADVYENRRLAITTLLCNCVALIGFALAPNYLSLLGAAFVAGATSSAIQILVPLIASLSSMERRGRVVGNVMSGLMLGILLSRPIASLIAGAYGWRTFYFIASGCTATAMAILVVFSPKLVPPTRMSWFSLIGSLANLLREESVLTKSALRQACCMVAFSIFWTAVSLRLAAAPFDLDSTGVALFALAGASGVIAAPLAGRIGDLGYSLLAQRVAHCTIVIACIVAAFAGSHGVSRHLEISAMVFAAFALDFAVICDQSLGRRAINIIRPDARGRTNGLFTGIFFVGGALGAALSGVTVKAGGWPLSCEVAAAFGLLALGISFLGNEAGE